MLTQGSCDLNGGSLLAMQFSQPVLEEAHHHDLEYFQQSVGTVTEKKAHFLTGREAIDKLWINRIFFFFTCRLYEFR